MAISAVTIFNAITLASTATKITPFGGVTTPVQVTTLAGNATAFNFIVTTGTVPPGPNASITFKYAFSMTDYIVTPGLSKVIPIVANSGALFNLRAPNVASTTVDITTPWSVPILGNFMYCWLELRGFTAPITSGFSAVALPVASCTTTHTRN